MAKTGPKRTTIQRERDLDIVSRLYLGGWTQEAIAVEVTRNYPPEFSITRRQIGYDIQKCIRRWQASQLLNIDAAKARELARIDKLEREAWDAWERSKADAETVTTKGKGSQAEPKPEHLERTIQRRGQVGDGSFLRIVEWCVEQRCKILGIYAPVQTDITSKGNQLNGGISDEQHARAIATLYDALRTTIGGADTGGQGAMGAAERTAMAGVAEPG